MRGESLKLKSMKFYMCCGGSSSYGCARQQHSMRWATGSGVAGVTIVCHEHLTTMCHSVSTCASSTHIHGGRKTPCDAKARVHLLVSDME
eukprot:scaffold41760_cov32-Tisochrysis_lutea.AAC.5